MTTTTENQQTKKAPPSDVIFPVGADGKPNYKARTAAWSHSKGGGKNFTIGGKRYVMFPNKPKPATEGSEMDLLRLDYLSFGRTQSVSFHVRSLFERREAVFD